MRWWRNLGGNSEVLIRPMPIDGNLTEGVALTLNTTTKGSTLKIGDATGTDFVGVLTQDKDGSSTAITTGTYVYAQCTIQPDALYKTQYDMAEANDIDVVSATSTSVTVAAGDDDMDGSWGFIRSGTGKGQLFFIGAATTTVYTLNTDKAFITMPDSTSDLILVRRVLRHPADSGIDLDSTIKLVKSAVSATGAFLCLENYVETQNGLIKPLRADEDHLTSVLDETKVRFYAELLPLDHVLRGASTMP